MSECGITDRDRKISDIENLLATGMETITDPFPKTHAEFAEILKELRELEPTDLRSKLVVAGFLDRPYGRALMRCRECTYYLIHKKWCDLPEVSLPVEPDWWCRLWRI